MTNKYTNFGHALKFRGEDAEPFDGNVVPAVFATKDVGKSATINTSPAGADHAGEEERWREDAGRFCKLHEKAPKLVAIERKGW